MRPSLLAAVLVAPVALAACSGQPPAPAAAPPASGSTAPGHAAGEHTVNLPRALGEWKRAEAPRRITAEAIFDYMDGAGELYLAYRFDHLDVFEYQAGDPSLGTVLVELYWMQTSDDAFGLLSTDWGGEAVPGEQSRGGGASAVRAAGAPPHRALYGAGLLRMCAGKLYARILAARETPASREAVLTLARSLAAAEPLAPAPTLVDAVAQGSFDGTRLRPQSLCYFRSHLVLNSAYFLASQDILALGPDVEGVTAEAQARPGGRPARVILVRYPSVERAVAGLKAFTTGYLPEAGAGGAPGATGAAKVEHGWVAWTQQGASVTIVLDAPGQDPARRLAGALADRAASQGAAPTGRPPASGLEP